MTPDLRIASLGYHDVADDPRESGFQRPGAWPYKLGPRPFAEQLARIAATAARPTSVLDVDFDRPGRHLLLTFDDGGRSAREIGAALAHRGWQGHFFVVTTLIGEPTFLDVAGIRDLRAAGHVVGSHSANHPDIFRDLDYASMVAEWRTSRQRLEDLLGEPCVVASVPGGDVSPRVLESAAAAGICYLFTSEPCLRPERVSACWVLGRFHVKRGMPAERIADLAAGRGWTRALVTRRLKGVVRAALPGVYRRYVGRSTRPY